MCLQPDEIVVPPFTGVSAVEKELIEKTFIVVQDSRAFYGIVTPADVLSTGHQLVIDCITSRVRINENDPVEKVLLIMNEERKHVLPVFSSQDEYIGCTTNTRIIEEIGLLKKQPAEIRINNIIGNYDIEMVKQEFIHELYHNTKNPIQVIYSSLSLFRATNSAQEKENLLDSIGESIKQVESTISELFYSYFDIN